MKKLDWLLFSLSLLSAGCSNPFGDSKSRVDDNYGVENTPPPSQAGYEVVSSSQTALSTNSGNHKVDVTVGSSTTAIRLKTTRDKTVYISVQGQMVSNQGM